MQYQYNQYQQTQVLTADQGRLILMMYEAALGSVKAAQARIADGDVPGRGKHVGRALALVGELRSTLNREQGGEVAENLDRLYEYVLHLLTDANVRNDACPLETAHRILTTLYEGWCGIFSGAGAQPHPLPAAPAGATLQIAAR